MLMALMVWLFEQIHVVPKMYKFLCHEITCHRNTEKNLKDINIHLLFILDQ